MGCNYYLRPKGYEPIKVINKTINDTLDNIVESYKYSIKKVIEEAEKISPLYKELFFTDLCIDDITHVLQWEVELPDLHICKLSYGWKPLFQKSKYFSTFKEFEDFYKLHTDIFDFVDEYDEIQDFEEFKEYVFEKVKDKKSQTHLQYNGGLPGLSLEYTKDKDGIEWTNHEFS